DAGPESTRGRRLQLELRHRCDGGQRLAAKTETADANEVAGVPDLAGGVALERKQRVVALHAAPVIRNANPCPSTVVHRDVNGGGAGIQRVLDEFLDDGRRALD